MLPLRDENGEHIKVQLADDQDLKQAYARFLLDKQTAVEVQNDITVLDVCLAYLRYAKTNGAEKTHFDRADTLFDFCFGLPPEYRKKDGSGPKRLTREQRAEMSNKRIHPGFGNLPAAELNWAHIDEWLSAHENWNGGCRTRVQAVKRALNFGVERDMIASNPIRGYKLARSNSRVTYITPEQEQAMYEHANPQLETAIRVCIRTGARFGSEFAKLTKEHIVDHGDRMEWVFKPSEIKNRRKRVIRITDPGVMEITRVCAEQFSQGPIFRNSVGTPWERRNLSQRFRTLKKRLSQQGVELDKDCCMYSCRHTFAKRILQGYWSGKPTNIETLARLMGNTPQVCREHYLQWSEIDNDPLWEAV
ncbi:tyrosine-type recombinase/integrase [Symmachiella dynata]|nr:hypothetical protein [Symmachiella dynata]